MNFEEAIQHEIDEDRRRSAEHGWSFRERVMPQFTIGDLVGAIMRINNPESAKEFYDSYIVHLNGRRDFSGAVVDVVNQNIGWCFGEGMAEERKEMWCSVTGAYHPVFGRRKPTTEEALTAGMAEAMKPGITKRIR